MNENTPQVLFNPPPIEMHDTILKYVTPYMERIPEDKTVGVFTVFTKDAKGAMQGNAVLAIKKGDILELGGFVGKSWGGPVVYGIESKFFF